MGQDSGSDRDVPADLPKSITHVSKKTSDTSKHVHSEDSQFKGSDSSVASEELKTEVGDMRVDESETSAEGRG